MLVDLTVYRGSNPRLGTTKTLKTPLIMTASFFVLLETVSAVVQPVVHSARPLVRRCPQPPRRGSRRARSSGALMVELASWFLLPCFSFRIYETMVERLSAGPQTPLGHKMLSKGSSWRTAAIAWRVFEATQALNVELAP